MRRIITLAAFAILAGGCSESATVDPPPVDPPGPTLELTLDSIGLGKAWDGTPRAVRGVVRNTGTQTLRDVRAVVEWPDTGAGSDEALIDATPLPPQGTATFSVDIAPDPRKASHALRFASGDADVPWVNGVPPAVTLFDEVALLLNRLVLADEHPRDGYRSSDYSYNSRTQEDSLVARYGAIWSPYEDRVFSTTDSTVVEHMVAVAEAHDSGAWAWDAERRDAFARDLDNQTLASTRVNSRKGDSDVAGWRPPYNMCWFVTQTLRVREKWSLTIDWAERLVAQAALERCPPGSDVLVLPPGG